MSTRCQIRFKFSDGNVLTYRHSDGYPSGVIPDLMEFLKWNKGRNDQSDYVVPNYFYYMKRQMEESYGKFKTGWSTSKKTKLPYILTRKMEGNESVLIGYGLDYRNTLHGDIEYFYDVEFIETENSRNMEFKITAYEVSLPYDEYKDVTVTPDQFVGLDRKPIFFIHINDIENETIPTSEFLDMVVDTYKKKKQEECNHVWKPSDIIEQDGTKWPDFCKKCYLDRTEVLAN